MPGFLGGGSSSGGAGGEISFPNELIDPVSKLRVSEPENLIDTDFEYGLQPTKWETVELINNTPSFFSKSGDTTIPNIVSITTVVGSREITVRTGLDHGLSVGIPINVNGTKSLTADGSYIINSIPNARTFTYLARENQFETGSIEDLYTSIATGEFFQGSQIKISDASGVVTSGAAPTSKLTVRTDSPHGFGPNTPLYFLNLNSTITQEFDSTNTEAKAFDASNNVTARTFDGSNTRDFARLRLNNTATSQPASVAGSAVTAVNIATNRITVTHSTQNFSTLRIGAPLQYFAVAPEGFFNQRPNGIVFLASEDQLGTTTSTFTVSATPNGAPINVSTNFSGTFQRADSVAQIAGDNRDPINQFSYNLLNEAPVSFDGDNSDGATRTVSNTSGLGNILFTANTNWTIGQMIFYVAGSTPITGLTNNTTYFVVATNAQTNLINISDRPNGDTITAISGGAGSTFRAISVSLDRDIINVPGHGFEEADMVQYNYPSGGRLNLGSVTSDYLFVETVLDENHIRLTTDRGFIRNGTTQPRAATSALAIRQAAPSSTDGAYWIQPPGAPAPYLTWCNFSLEGGGWTQIMKLSTNTLLTNGLPAGNAPQSGAGFTFGPHWDGWLWNTDAQFTNLFPLANNATNTDVDAFSPLFYQLPFNEVMVLSTNNPAQRVGWRHNNTISNMRSVTGASDRSTYGDTWLFPNVSDDEKSWVRRLQTQGGVAQFVSQSNFHFGFKTLSDYANNYGNAGQFLTGGYNTVNSGGVTGHGVSMIGMGGKANNSGRWGGGIGFSYTQNNPWRAHGHWWNQGNTSGATANRTFTGLTVFVR
jgi:hypothetical protein